MIELFLSQLRAYLKTPVEMGEAGRAPLIPWGYMCLVILLFAILAQILAYLQLSLLGVEIDVAESDVATPYSLFARISPFQMVILNFVTTLLYFFGYILFSRAFSKIPSQAAATSLIRFFIIQRVFFIGLGLIGFALTFLPGIGSLFNLFSLGVLVYFAFISLGVAKGAFGFQSRWTSFGVAVLTGFSLSFVITLAMILASSFGWIDLQGLVEVNNEF